jgi:hypothetical protein
MARCLDSSAYILDQTLCLYEISKDMREGSLRSALHEQESCLERRCETFKTIHQLDLELQAGPCDSEQSRPHNGRLYSCDLTHALNPRNGTSDGRGFHGGTFTWADQGFLASGTLSGITNAGTHRGPIFDPACQRCDDVHFMEGRLCGIIRRSTDQSTLGCQVFGAYRLQFAQELTAPRNAVRGVLEGMIVCECRPAESSGHEAFHPEDTTRAE